MSFLYIQYSVNEILINIHYIRGEKLGKKSRGEEIRQKFQRRNDLK